MTRSHTFSIIVHPNAFLAESFQNHKLGTVRKRWTIDEFGYDIIIERIEAKKYIIYGIYFEAIEPYDMEFIIQKKEIKGIPIDLIDKIITFIVIAEEINNIKDEVRSKYEDKIRICKELYNEKECIIKEQKKYDEEIKELEEILQKYRVNNVKIQWIDLSNDPEATSIIKVKIYKNNVI